MEFFRAFMNELKSPGPLLHFEGNPNAMRDAQKSIIENLDTTNLFLIGQDIFKANKAMVSSKTPLNILDLAPPFKTCWFQNASRNGITIPGTYISCYGLLLDEIRPYYFNFAFLTDNLTIKPGAFKKNDPTWEYVNGKLRESSDGNVEAGYVNPQDFVKEGYHLRLGQVDIRDKEIRGDAADILNYIHGYLSIFQLQNYQGFEEIKEKIKFRRPSTGEKIHHKIKKIIHITARTEKAKREIASVTGRQIDWSHRWAVRGHWRKVPGIGKNRAEEYEVQGFTWVKDCIKGDKKLPFVKKTRIFTPKISTPQGAV